MFHRSPHLVPVAIAAFLLLASPRTASALDFKVGGESLRLDITESMWASWHLDNGNSYFSPNPNRDPKLPPCIAGGKDPSCYAGDITDDNYGEVLNRLNVQLAWKRFLFSVRFDSGFWANTPGASLLASQKYSDRRFVSPDRAANRGATTLGVKVGVAGFYLEKISASYIGRSVEVTLGDFYTNLGRGMVLSVRKIDELGIDTTITGAKVLVHQGNFNAQVLAGFANVQNFDQTRAQWIEESNDFLAAAHFDYHFSKRLTLGANAMWGTPGCPTGQTCTGGSVFLSDPTNNYYLRPGLVIDAPKLFSWLGFYAEYVRQQDHVIRADGTYSLENGNALYAAADMYFGSVNVLLEGKWYDNFQPWHATSAGKPSNPFDNVFYMVPPTLERVIVPLNNNTDIIAGRVKLGKRFSRNASVFASAEVGQSHPDVGYLDTLVDVYGGAELRWNEGRSHLFPLVEYRHEHQDLTPGVTPKTEEQIVATEWDFAQELGHRFALESAGLIWFRRKPLEGNVFGPGNSVLVATINDNAWAEGQVYLSLKWASKITVSAGYEFTTATTEKLHTHDFPNGQVMWNITSGTSIALFAGGNRPGLKCISGVCRDFPAFEGVKLELVVRL